jgi:hypothetical protein
MTFEQLTVPAAVHLQAGDKSLVTSTTSKPRGRSKRVTAENNEDLISSIDTNSSSSKFQDLYWFINPKTENNETLNTGEAGLCILSFNMGFGNIRVNLYDKNPKDWMRGSALFLEDKVTTHAAIYPASMFTILRMEEGKSHTCVEQLVNPYRGLKWQNDLSTCTIEKVNGNINLSITNNANKSNIIYYTFADVQRDMFVQALNYCINFGQQLCCLYQINCR